MTVVPEAALTIGADGRRATLTLRDLAVIDQPGWPEHGATPTPAVMSFTAVWEANDEPVEYEDRDRRFRVRGWRAAARLQASVDVPSLGFSWRSDPIEASSAAFGIIGEEVNGRYFTG